MREHNESMSTDPIRESRRITAEVIRDVARTSGRSITISGQEVPAHKLLGDATLVGALLKIGLFSVGAQPFSDMRLESFGGRTAGTPMPTVPTAMIAMSFGYALKVGGKSKEEIVLWARRIEKRLGSIPLDPVLMSEIASLAAEEES